MKLSKALKTKNILVNEIQALKEKICKYNSFRNENPAPMDTNELWKELYSKVKTLAYLKEKISIANQGIHKFIFEMAEYKGLIAFLKTVNTMSGRHFTENFKGQQYGFMQVAQITDVKVNDLINDLTKSINELQDKIDEYNAITEIKD